MIVFVGSINADAVAVVPHLPGLDERLEASSVVHAGGGNAATAAVAAARLGVAAAFVGPVSTDAVGSRLVEELAAEGVDVSGVVPVPAGEGGASVILIDAHSGARSICVRQAAPFQVPESAYELLAGASWVQVDQLGWGSLGAAPVPRLAVDAGNPVSDLDLARVDLYAPTVSALRQAYGPGTVTSLLCRARAEGARTVVATDGADGAHGMGEDGRLVSVPGFSGVTVRSTLGAGDVFHGALLAALSRGGELAASMRYACAAAALSCREIDARSGIPTDPEVHRVSKAPGGLVKDFGAMTDTTDSSEYAETFDLIDADDDGLITASELVRLMQALGSSVTEETAEAGVRKFDADGDGLLTLPEFTAFMESGR